MNDKLVVSQSPHWGNGVTTKQIMKDVLVALMPTVGAAVIFFGVRALLLVVITATTCLVAEYVSRRIMKRPQTIGDLSALVTGVLLACNYPVGLPIWMAILGGLIAIVVVKQFFGGIGFNFVNPALLARVILMVSFPIAMTTWTAPLLGDASDVVSAATPLALLLSEAGASPSYMNLFLGNIAGSLGETSSLALLLGGAYLIVRKVITPLIPVTFIGVVVTLTALLGQDPFVHLLSGGLLIGAIFMATDYTTAPLTSKGKFIYAAGCGLLTTLIRVFGSLPEGVSFAIILMNLLVPHIEHLTLAKGGDKR